MTIDLKGFAGLQDRIKDFPAKLTQKVDDVLTANATAIAEKAQHTASTFKDNGGLQNSISADNSKPLEKHIVANAFYAAFVEFGTGKFAAQRVGTLPADWQTFAKQFHGKKGGGDIQDFYHKLIAWVMRKGIHGTTKSGRAKKGKQAEAEAAAIAYLIMRRILRDGIRSHPFLYPAFAQQRKQIKADAERILKEL